MTKNVFTLIIAFGVFMNFYVHNTHAAESSSTPSNPPLSCPAGDLIRVIRRSFRKVIPEYNPNTVTVEVKTDSKFRIKPSDPNWFDFILQFQDLSESLISREEPIQLLRISMKTVLAYEFSSFQFTHGRPLSCISYYVGATDDYNRVLTVYKRAFQSHRYFSKRLFAAPEEDFSPVKGKQILQRLGIFFHSRSSVRSYDKSKKPNEKVCSEFIIEAKDGRILAKYPTVNTLPRFIRIPGEKEPVNAYKHNVTHSLQKYYETALSCLESDELRLQYSSSLASWISDKLVPTLLDARVCSRGFPRLLLFLASLDSSAYPQKVSKADAQKMVGRSSNDDYGLDSDYEPVQALSLAGQEREDTSNRSTHVDAIAASASATIFLIFFACFLPLLFLVYHLYMKDPRSLSLRKWFADKLAAESNLPKPRRKPRRKPRTPDEQPLIPSSTEHDEPKKNFRENSRDIYIQMAEYPLDISIEERDESTDDSSGDLSDELNITKKGPKKLPSRVQQQGPGNKKALRGSAAGRTDKNKKNVFDDDDGSDEEELFSRQVKGQGSVYDFTSSKKGDRQRRQREYKPAYAQGKASRNKSADVLKRDSSGKLVLPMVSKRNNSLDSRKFGRAEDMRGKKKTRNKEDFG